MHQILWDSDTQTDHHILARRLDLVLINTESTVLGDYQFFTNGIIGMNLNENEKLDKHLNLSPIMKKQILKVTVMPRISESPRNNPKEDIKETKGTINPRKNRNRLDYSTTDTRFSWQLSKNKRKRKDRQILRSCQRVKKKSFKAWRWWYYYLS